ncbi:DUF397 domain-containing protein [Streptomyces rimosus]|uniref:DUF397 domain-containing protein n=1 Tax=Streptomyces rimosus TaxID=1927 RepID=UPI0004C579E7|nr:DUF397 domain-containing protein [Streptomyces rimosus]
MPQLIWQKSSFSTHAQDDCLEVAAPTGGPVLYRESDHPRAVGRATAPGWAAFLRAVKADRCAPGRR